MFDNVAFEVAIGLVFVYLLYSLLITILGELVAAWLGLRSRILRVAIERMLNDGYYKAVQKKKSPLEDFAFKAWYWINNTCRHFFLYQSKYFNDSFAGRFYNYPSIKYLAKLEADQKVFFENTKPAYITSENFASTLINFLSEKGNGRTRLEQLRFALTYNTLHIQPETAKNITAILNEAGNDVDRFKEQLMQWFDETMDRATGWYKRKIRFILFWLGFLLALTFNVDSISIARILANDKDARNQLVSMGVALSKDSSRYSAFVNKNGDTVHAKEILDSGYSHITQDISQANLVLGLGWDFSKLRKKTQVSIDNTDKGYKEALALQSYNDVIKEQQALLKHISDTTFLLASLTQRSFTLNTQLQVDSILLSAQQSDTARRNNSIQTRNDLISTNKSGNLLQAQLRNDSAALAGITLLLIHADKEAQAATKNSLSGFDSAVLADNKNEVVIHGSRNYSWFEKVRYVLANIFGKSLRLLGLIVTAFALSLGAPFWFGVLNKLASIRAAGVKPDDKTDADDAPKLSNHPVQSQPTSNSIIPDVITADKAEIALDLFTLKIHEEPGIVAIGLEAENKNPSAFIRVMTESDDVVEYLKKKYGEAQEVETDLLFQPAFSIPVKYSVQTINSAHATAIANAISTQIPGLEIANISGDLGSGTLGCFLKKKGSDKRYMLSCWHVMKDDSNWENAIVKKEIVDSKDAVIAMVEHGCLADTIDVGIAVCNEDVPVINTNDTFTITAQHREVKPFDAVMSTPVQLYGNVSQYRTAKIFHHKINALINYPDGRTHLMLDVFSITNGMSSPTSGGDSGAVVTDMKGVPLGMIIGGNDTFSYAVKFTNMFSENKLYSEYSFLIKKA